MPVYPATIAKTAREDPCNLVHITCSSHRPLRMSSSGKGQSILEKWLEDMPNSNQPPIKKERRDFDDLLARTTNSTANLFSNSSFSLSSSSLPSTFPSSSPHPNGFNRANTESSNSTKKQATPAAQDSSNQIDAKSIKGIFGWSTVNDIPLPLILRGEQKLVPVRVVESKIIGRYSECLPWTVFSCINIRSYYVTDNEAKLLNEINAFHCDYHYGYEPFTGKDVVVCISDVKKLSRFLETSKDVFAYGLSKLKLDWLGFVNISRSLIVPYIAKHQSSSSPTPTPPNTFSSSNDNNDCENSTISNDNNQYIPQRYVPESMISNHLLLVKVDKIEMNEWDASYLRMLCIYAGLDHYQIPPNDNLCLLSDIKWDSSLCSLAVEEYEPPVKLTMPPLNNCIPSRSNPSSPMPVNNFQSATSDIQPNSPSSKSTNSDSMDHQPWMRTINGCIGSNSSYNSPHHITKVDINGISLSAINLKPYSNTQQAVLWNDVIAKMFPGISPVAAQYFFEKALQVKLHEFNSLHKGAFARVNVHISPGDKLVTVDVLRKYLPQLTKLILMSLTPHHFIN